MTLQNVMIELGAGALVGRISSTLQIRHALSIVDLPAQQGAERLHQSWWLGYWPCLSRV
jgi:hypothetical protein